MLCEESVAVRCEWLGKNHACKQDVQFDVFLARNKRRKHGEKDTIMNYAKHLMNQTLISYIKVKRLAWAGHLMRMNNDKAL
jgi:hypothetical protein